MLCLLVQVFCSKQLPRCGACPLQYMCEYALHKGARLDLPTKYMAAPTTGTADTIDIFDTGSKSVRETVDGQVNSQTGCGESGVVRDLEDYGQVYIGILWCKLHLDADMFLMRPSYQLNCNP